MTPLYGLADTHAHFVAHRGFGGYGIFGSAVPSTAGGIASALPRCTRAHGPWGLLPTLDGVGHRTGGWPRFDGWPTHRTHAHQQAYVDWIRRAVDGGLRLAVCLAVHNELVARRFGWPWARRSPGGDLAAIDAQLSALRELVRHIDDSCGGPGRGWAAIATDPARARDIVAAGNLALVPGIEVDAPGGWYTPEQLEAQAAAEHTTPERLIEALVDDLHRRGVRHVFPVHATMNAFGAPAIFARSYDAANYVLTGRSFEVETAPPELGIGYRLDEDEFDGGAIAERFGYHGWAGLFRRGGPPRPVNWSAVPGGHINAAGLTRHGETLLRELIRRGMVIDVDHMGHKTMGTVLDLCARHGYPVVSGHSTPRAMRRADGVRPRMRATENNRSPEQLACIRRLGGLVSVFLYQRDARPSGPVANDCAGSARSFAQVLHHVHGALDGRIALGSDVNGAGQLPGPRFGPHGAAGIRDDADRAGRLSRREEVLRQTSGVRYATPARPAPVGGVFTTVERRFWEALVAWRAGVRPPGRWWRAPGLSLNLWCGLRAGGREELPLPVPGRFRRAQPAVQLAALLAREGGTCRADDPAGTRALLPVLRRIYTHWSSMDGGTAPVPASPLRTADGAMIRSRAGDREFDVNTDGVAHYGMLPDFLQDLRNVGTPAAETDALHRGAEHYIQVWERCLRQAP